MRKRSILAVAALLGGSPAAAQQGEGQHQMPMQGQATQSMQHCMAMMGGPTPQMLLQHREALDLSAEQVTRLEVLQERAGETEMPHMQPAMQAHGDARLVLTPEQLGKVDDLRHGMMSGGEHGMMGAGRAQLDHGAMDGMAMGGMAMGHMTACMTMGGGMEQSEQRGHTH